MTESLTFVDTPYISRPRICSHFYINTPHGQRKSFVDQLVMYIVDLGIRRGRSVIVRETGRPGFDFQSRQSWWSAHGRALRAGHIS